MSHYTDGASPIIGTAITAAYDFVTIVNLVRRLFAQTMFKAEAYHSDEGILSGNVTLQTRSNCTSNYMYEDECSAAWCTAKTPVQWASCHNDNCSLDPGRTSRDHDGDITIFSEALNREH